MPVDTNSTELPALFTLEEGLANALLHAPRSQAIGAALAFLLHCAESMHTQDHVKLRRALNGIVTGSPFGHRIIDILTTAAR